MTEHDMEKIAKGSHELLKILDEYKQTEKLLNEQKWNELQDYVRKIIDEYYGEAVLHNVTHAYMPQTVEQNGRNCMTFLKELFVKKAVSLGIDLMNH